MKIIILDADDLTDSELMRLALEAAIMARSPDGREGETRCVFAHDTAGVYECARASDHIQARLRR